MTTPLNPGARALVAAFAVSGTIHLVRPGVFEPIIPAPLRAWDTELVVLSGVADGPGRGARRRLRAQAPW